MPVKSGKYMKAGSGFHGGNTNNLPGNCLECGGFCDGICKMSDRELEEAILKEEMRHVHLERRLAAAKREAKRIAKERDENKTEHTPGHSIAKDKKLPGNKKGHRSKRFDPPHTETETKSAASQTTPIP